MKILNESEVLTPQGVAMAEEKYNALFVCDTCLKAQGGGWINQSVAVFWNKDPANIPEGGSAYFGLYIQYMPPDFKRGPVMITNAISAVETDIIGMVAHNGDVIYSRYRHDYRGSPDGSVWIDGGRDYTRHGGFGSLVTLRINDGVLGVVPLWKGEAQKPEVRNPTPSPELQNSEGWEFK